MACASTSTQHIDIDDEHPLVLIIAGATGDLTRRKLMPALLNLYSHGKLPENLTIICTAYDKGSTAQFRRSVAHAVQSFAQQHHITARTQQHFLEHLRYISIDIVHPADEGWHQLKVNLDDPRQIRIFYLATPSKLYRPFINAIARHKLSTPTSRIALEKPIGHSRESAASINAHVSEIFDEPSIFRVDHYLGKEGVQNILTLRRNNPYLRHIWSHKYISSIQITAAETLGVGDRHSYYDDAGALRDMVQNHLLQMLCFVGMELPQTRDALELHQRKIDFFHTLPLVDHEMLQKDVVRGQYSNGRIDEAPVGAYIDDLKLGRPSNTETYVALRVCPQSARWQGTPFYLRTGKRLPHKTTEIVVTFKDPCDTDVPAGYLAIHIAPHNRIMLTMSVKDPREDKPQIATCPMTIDYEPFCTPQRQHAYETLLLELINGDTSLFAHRDEIDLSWRWVENILQLWHNDPSPIPLYHAGEWGPAGAQELVRQDKQRWFEDITL